MIPISNPRRRLLTPPSECRWIAVLVCMVLVCKINALTLRPLTFEPQNSTTSMVSQDHSLHQVWTLWDHSFLRASAMLKHVIDIGWTSVRLSVTRWHCIKTAEYIVMLSPPHNSAFILVLCISRSSRNSDGVTPCGGAKYRWGIKIERFSTNKTLYLANDTRYRHGYYGRRIGNRTQAFEWHQFQWPCGTFKPDFKVTILFNVK